MFILSSTAEIGFHLVYNPAASFPHTLNPRQVEVEDSSFLPEEIRLSILRSLAVAYRLVDWRWALKFAAALDPRIDTLSMVTIYVMERCWDTAACIAAVEVGYREFVVDKMERL